MRMPWNGSRTRRWGTLVGTRCYSGKRRNSPSFNSTKVSSNTRKNRPGSSDSEMFSKSLESAACISFSSSGLMRMRTTPAWAENGYWSVLAKSVSWVRRMRDSVLDCAATCRSCVPLETGRTSWPSERRNGDNFAWRFSSARNCMATGVHEGGIVAAGFHRSSRKLQSRFDMLRSQIWIGLPDVGYRTPAFQHLKNKVDHDPGALEARFTVADIRVNTDVPTDFHGNQSIDGRSREVNQPDV